MTKTTNKVDSLSNSSTQSHQSINTDSSRTKKNTTTVVSNEKNDYKKITMEGQAITDVFGDGFSVGGSTNDSIKPGNGNAKSPPRKSLLDFKNFVPERITIELGHQTKEQVIISNDNDSSGVKKNETIATTANQQTNLNKESTHKTRNVEKKGSWPWYLWLIIILAVLYALYQLYVYLKPKYLI